MPNIATALKAEISRVARKEIRSETENLKKAASAARSEISALRKEVRELSRALKVAQRQVAKAAPVKAAPKGAQKGEEEGGKALRFSAARLAAQRARLGLSVANMAKLIGVSSVTLYKWESCQARPRRAQLEAIARVRGLGKREAAEQLQSVSS